MKCVRPDREMRALYRFLEAARASGSPSTRSGEGVRGRSPSCSWWRART